MNLLHPCLVTVIIAGSLSASAQVLSLESKVVGRAVHENTVQTIQEVRFEDGSSQRYTNSYVHLEPGVNYQDEAGTWQESIPRIEVLPDGRAGMLRAQHRVIFSPKSTSEGAVDYTFPDGRRMRSQVFGLVYYDPITGDSALVAPVREVSGEIVSENQVVYPDAFEDLRADILYECGKAHFSQYIVLHERPPGPDTWGLSPQSRLEVWTEIVESPQPSRSLRVLNERELETGVDSTPFTDETLDFGSMAMIEGRAFLSTDGGGDSPSAPRVGKTWKDVSNRRFLIEAVRVRSLEDELQQLPDAGGASIRPRARTREVVAAQRVKPASPRPGAFSAPRPLQAGGDFRSSRGYLAGLSKAVVVLDYETVNPGTLNNKVFASDVTYSIGGAVTLTGTGTKFEGGTVIKFVPGAQLRLNSIPIWEGAPYKPVIFTARDDHSVGEAITTNALSGYYANAALYLDGNTAGSSFDLKYLRISHATAGITLPNRTGHFFRHVQFMNCQDAIKPAGSGFTLLNGLMAGVQNCFNGSGASAVLQHLTVDGANWLNANGTFASTTLSLTNCLLVAVTNYGAYQGTPNGISSTAGGVFQKVSGGGRYLAQGSPFRSVGITGIDTNLRSDLAKLTTYAPTLLSGTISASTTLGPVVARDVGTPDLGYHYPCLDYLTSGYITVTNCTLTLTNGVALGFTDATALALRRNSKLVSGGLPTRPNVITRYSTVIETNQGAINPLFSQTVLNSGFSSGLSLAETPTADIRFTLFSMPSPGAYHFYTLGSGWTMGSLKVRDSEFYGGRMWLGGPSSSAVVELKNNLHIHNEFTADGSPSFSMYNSLLRASTNLFNAPVGNAWVVRDNSFDTSVNADWGATMTASHNAFINGSARLNPGTQTSDVILGSFTYATSNLGPWYQSTTSLQNVGSRTASSAGFYHYTTLAAQTKEAATQVDIGLHYTSIDSATGGAIDADGDATPDYLEDINGDGTQNGTETNWNQSQSGIPAGSKIIVFTPLK